MVRHGKENVQHSSQERIQLSSKRGNISHYLRRNIRKKKHEGTMNGLTCICGKIASYKNDVHFQQHILEGRECKYCGEEYLDPGQAEFILRLNRFKRMTARSGNKRRNDDMILVPKGAGDILQVLSRNDVKMTFGKKRILIQLQNHQRT